MIFSTYFFLFIFLPVVFTGYFLLNRIKQVVAARWWLVGSSLYFYSYGATQYLWLFVFCMLFNFYIGKVLGALQQNEPSNASIHKRRFILLIGVGVNLAILGHFKYYNFFLENINFILGSQIALVKIALPLGISFYTFQNVAYLVDSYRGITRDFSLLNYMLFITFFPQLIVGPIVHHNQVIPQFCNLRRSRLNFTNIACGIFLLSIGFAKKLLLADPLTGFGFNAFQHVQILSMTESWYGSLSYVLSYYFDLSGYADMAVGLGLLFNIHLPVNFNSPYKARNFAEYWRRWHITLSSFLSDYVFKNIYKRGGGSRNFYIAVLITFLVSGIWHGAGWTFIAWGLLNGIFVVSSHMMKRANKALPFTIAWALTFAGVILTRILFVSASFDDAFHVCKTMLDFSKLQFDNQQFIGGIPHHIYLFIGFAICFFLPNSMQIKEKFKPNWVFLTFTAILLIASLLKMGEVKSFLYFQF